LVRFEYQPWKKVVVHEVVKFPLDFILSTHSLGVPEGGVGRAVNWVDGIVFEHTPMPPTEDVIREQLSGQVHWNSIGYTLLDKYQPIFTVGSIRIPVIDLSTSQTFRDMAKWIRDNFEK